MASRRDGSISRDFSILSVIDTDNFVMKYKSVKRNYKLAIGECINNIQM